jgi:hypothetical protein
MISLLTSILCVLRNIALAVAWALTEVINLVIVALGLFGAFLVDLLPAFPEVPPAPGGDAAGWIAWFVPASGILAAFVAFGASYLVFLAVRIALRWVKAL